MRLVDEKGGIKNVEALQSLLLLIDDTNNEHWVVRSTIVESIMRSSEDVQNHFIRSDDLMIVLKDWLKELKGKDAHQSSQESLIFKILESLLTLPVRSRARPWTLIVLSLSAT